MVSALNSGLSGLGSSSGPGTFCCFHGQDILLLTVLLSPAPLSCMLGNPVFVSIPTKL